MEPKICVLVVTYNRKQYLKNLILKGLMNQTYPIDKIVLYDNCSSDGTAEMLRELGIIKDYPGLDSGNNIYNGITFTYYFSFVNEGGSAGFHEGMKIALEQGCDYIWVMDDDVLPEPDCLENLIKHISKDNRIVVPSRTDSRFEDSVVVNVNMSNPFLFRLPACRTVISSADIKEECIIIKDMPFEGPLIDVSLVRQIGFPKKDLFIFYDDTEYAFRASQVTDILYIKSAILHKQIIIDKNMKTQGWRLYYLRRNQFWFHHTYGENVFVRNIRPRLSFITSCMKFFVNGDWRELRVLIRAYHDGIRGILGKTISWTDNN